MYSSSKKGIILTMDKTVSTLLAWILLLSPLLAADWTQQMGPNRDGVVPGDGLAAEWKDGKLPVLWQTSAGFGTAPVVVEKGRLYTFGLFKPGTKPEDILLPASTPTFEEVQTGSVLNGQPLSTRQLPDSPLWAEDHHPAYRADEYAFCLDAATGKLLWASKLTDWGIAYVANAYWGDMASPLLANGKLYLHSPTGRLYALDASNGKPLWQVNLFKHQMLQWTEKECNCAGPLLVGNTVIVTYNGGENADYTKWTRTCLVAAGFDAATGENRWVTKAPFEGFRTMNARFGYAVINGEPTVLCGCGKGTMGLDPQTGKVRWSFALPPDKAIWAPYLSYAPVVWKNYVIDSVSVAHDDKPSATWCLQIVDNQAKLIWLTHDFVPHVEIGKSNMLVKDGKLYGADAHGIWDTPGKPSEERVWPPQAPKNLKPMEPGRNFRGKDVGQFQCRDVLTGKLLWSTSAFQPGTVDPLKWPGEWSSTHSILVADRLILFNTWGLWIAQLSDTGVKVLAQGPGFEREGSEPVLVDGRLYVRQVALRHSFQNESNGSYGRGNLICYDLRARDR